LAGIRDLKIEEALDSEMLADAVQVVKDHVTILKALARPELICIVEKELMEREQPKGADDSGELVMGSQVIVSLDQPSDTTLHFADRVLRNLKAGIRYDYYLSADRNLKLVAQLVQSLAAAEGAGNGEDDQERRRKAMAEPANSSKVRRRRC
jgi:hypothetical protein